jgi:hypothetical protein
MSDLTLVLESARISSGRLELTPVAHPTNPEGAQRPTWHVKMTGPHEMSATIVTHENDDEERTLAEFFAWLHEDRLGFDGAREWESFGGALYFHCIHDQINVVKTAVRLRGGFYVAQWTASLMLMMDPGRFDRLALNAELYFDRFRGVAEETSY